MKGFGGIEKNSGGFIGTSITLAVRAGVTAAQALPVLVGDKKTYRPSINAGVAGENSTRGLARFGRDVLAFGPSMVSIEFGHNDPGAV